MLFHRIVPSLLLLSGLAAAEPTTPIATAAPESAQSVVRADLERLRREALTVKPTSLFADPEARKAIEHFHQQLIIAMRSERDMPPFLDVLLQSRNGMLALGFKPVENANQREDDLITIGCLIDAAGSAGLVRQWFDERIAEMNNGEEITLGAYAGWKNREAFVGHAGTTVAIASALIYSSWPASAGLTDVPKTAIGATIDLSPLTAAMNAIATHDQRSEEGAFFSVLPELVMSEPRLTVSIDPAAGWESRLRLDGIGSLPFIGSIDPVVPARLGKQDALLTFALDPSALIERMLIASARGRTMEQVKADVEQALTEQGLSLELLRNMCSGTISIGANWRSGPIPTVLAAVGVRDPKPLQTMLKLMADATGTAPVAIDGALAAYTFEQLPVPVTVVLGQDVLVASQDAALASASLAKPHQIPAVTPGEVLSLHVSRSLMATGLQTAWNQIISVDEALSSDDRTRAGWLLNTCIDRLSSQDTAAAATFAALAGTEQEPRDLFEHAIRSLRQNAGTPAEGDDFAWADGHLSLFVVAPTTETMFTTGSLVWREADGWRRFDQDTYRVSKLDAEGLAALVQACPRRIGGDPQQLPTLQFPEVARLDVACIPPLGAVLRHLPDQYRLTLSTYPNGLEIREQGLPIAGSVLGTLAFLSPVATYEIQRKSLWQQRSARQDALRLKHETIYASLEAAGQALQNGRANGKPIPALASGLLEADFGLDIASLAGLNNGETPADAKAVDAIGVWTSDNEERIWSIPVEPGVTLVLQYWGNLEFVETPPVSK